MTHSPPQGGCSRDTNTSIEGDLSLAIQGEPSPVPSGQQRGSPLECSKTSTVASTAPGSRLHPWDARQQTAPLPPCRRLALLDGDSSSNGRSQRRCGRSASTRDARHTVVEPCPGGRSTSNSELHDRRYIRSRQLCPVETLKSYCWDVPGFVLNGTSYKL